MNRFTKLWPGNDLTLLVMGICPLLVIVTNMVIGFCVGFLFFITFVFSGMAVSLLKNLFSIELRFFSIIMITSSLVSSFVLITQYWFFPLTEALDFYIYLVAINCLVVAFAEEIALRHPPFLVLYDSVIVGLLVFLVFFMIGFIRETAGSGTLFQDAELLFGDIASDWTIQIVQDGGIKFIKYIPGSFFVLGLLIAGYNLISGKSEQST